MKLSVLIPTFRRPKDLQLVLDTLKKQERFPDQVIVTVRDIDKETRDFFATYPVAPLPLQVVDVFEPGVVAAMNAGLAAVTGDIVALTDDDTEPFPDWLKRIEELFKSDPRIAGVGGRDFLNFDDGAETASVGRVQWFGRIIGNHHLGTGPAREVDLLKGANCAYRTIPLRALGFDTRLLGKGAQVHWELGLGLALRNAGWKLIYDPAIGLHHHMAVRHGDDQYHRGIFTPEPFVQAIHNETMFLWKFLSPGGRAAFLVWSFFVGTRGTPGLLQLARFRFKPAMLQRFSPMIAGRLAGIRTARTVPAPGAIPPSPETVATQNTADRPKATVEG